LGHEAAERSRGGAGNETTGDGSRGIKQQRYWGSAAGRCNDGRRGLSMKDMKGCLIRKHDFS